MHTQTLEYTRNITHTSLSFLHTYTLTHSHHYEHTDILKHARTHVGATNVFVFSCMHACMRVRVCLCMGAHDDDGAFEQQAMNICILARYGNGGKIAYMPTTQCGGHTGSGPSSQVYYYYADFYHCALDVWSFVPHLRLCSICNLYAYGPCVYSCPCIIGNVFHMCAYARRHVRQSAGMW